ncbi:MAG: cobalamin-dependent protein [Thermodesulfobacteriota bacterium]
MIDEIRYRSYFDALLTGRRNTCRNIVLKLREEDVPLESIYVDLFQRSLYEIGSMWEQNRISVATEHLATAITEYLMAVLYSTLFIPDPKDRSIVVSCVANEYHQIGGKMVADILEARGWNTYFLGANTPIADMLNLVQEKRPDWVALSLSVYFNMPQLERAIEELRRIGSGFGIVVGGQAFQWCKTAFTERYPDIPICASLYDIDVLEPISKKARTR